MRRSSGRTSARRRARRGPAPRDGVEAHGLAEPAQPLGKSAKELGEVRGPTRGTAVGERAAQSRSAAVERAALDQQHPFEAAPGLLELEKAVRRRDVDQLRDPLLRGGEVAVHDGDPAGGGAQYRAQRELEILDRRIANQVSICTAAVSTGASSHSPIASRFLASRC